ncbi:hypothetical protein [Priestia megaterium]|nr:hypothetical protein [Priestia megaterium]
MIKKLDHFVLTVKNIEKTTLLKKRMHEAFSFTRPYKLLLQL